MNRFDIHLTVGLFVIAGLICLGYLSVRLGGVDLFKNNGYELYALFSNSGGIKSGSQIMIAGVEVGRIRGVELDDYQAKIMLAVRNNVKIHEDAIASIKTRGLVGEKYIEITPGGSEKMLDPGDRIRETESAIDIEQLISNYVFGKM